MNTFKANTIQDTKKTAIVNWFCNRGEPLKPSDIKFFQVGTVEGEHRGIAVVIDTKGRLDHLDTVKGEVDIYCTDSMCCELYDSINREFVE